MKRKSDTECLNATVEQALICSFKTLHIHCIETGVTTSLRFEVVRLIECTMLPSQSQLV